MTVPPNIQFKLDRAQPLNQAEMSLILKDLFAKLEALENRVEKLSANKQESSRRVRKNVPTNPVRSSDIE